MTSSASAVRKEPEEKQEGVGGLSSMGASGLKGQASLRHRH